MVTESMKGKCCLYKPILCSEGYCQDCQVYLDYQGHQRTMGRESVVVSRKDANNEVCLRCGASRSVLREFLSGGRGEKTIANHILKNCRSCAKAFKIPQKD